jgi:2-C-methyl-D-erythritol 4-phosphate cytidylyltransferase
MAVALIVAAGRGERLGSDRPKALVTLAGRPLLDWSVESLRRVAEVRQIVVALPAGELAAAPPGTVAVAGGRVRSDSVKRALAQAPGSDPVLVHDAARPLASPELFARALAELRHSGADAVVAATPVSDTIKEVAADGRTVAATLSRSRLWAVQTPQVFRRDALQQALGAASDDQLAAATDDAWLIEQDGGRVQVVAGEPRNLKVTTPIDLRLAELLLVQSGSAAAPA